MPYYNPYLQNTLSSGNSSSIRLLDEEEKKTTGLQPPYFNLMEGQASIAQSPFSAKRGSNISSESLRSFGSVFNQLYNSTSNTTNNNQQNNTTENKKEALKNKINELEELASDALKNGNVTEYMEIKKALSILYKELNSPPAEIQQGNENDQESDSTSNGDPGNDNCYEGQDNGSGISNSGECDNSNEEYTPPTFSSGSFDFNSPSFGDASIGDSESDSLAGDNVASASSLDDDDKR